MVINFNEVVTLMTVGFFSCFCIFLVLGHFHTRQVTPCKFQMFLGSFFHVRLFPIISVINSQPTIGVDTRCYWPFLILQVIQKPIVLLFIYIIIYLNVLLLSWKIRLSEPAYTRIILNIINQLVSYSILWPIHQFKCSFILLLGLC